MLPETDWSRLYYALVLVRFGNKGEHYKILGIGETITDAKVDAAKRTPELKTRREYYLGPGYFDRIMKLDLNTKAYTAVTFCLSYYTVMYIEAKVYEYAKMWDVEQFDVMLDPSVKENLLRFVSKKTKSPSVYKDVSDSDSQLPKD